MKKCPFNKFKKCQDDCELFVQRTRQYTGKLDTVIIQGCSLRLGTDEEENMSNRLAMVHQETGESKNIGLYAALANLGHKEGFSLLAKKAGQLMQEELTDDNF